MASHKKKIKLKVHTNRVKSTKKSLEERVIKDEGFIEDFDEKVHYYVDEYVEKIERTKQLTLISIVSFFMLLIVSLYALSFKSQITTLADNDKNKTDNFGDIKSDFSEMVENFNQIKETINIGVEEINTTKNSSNGVNILPESQNTDIVSIEELKEKLLEKNK